LVLEGRVTDPRELAAYVSALGRDGSAVGGMAIDVVETRADENGATTQPAGAAAAPAKSLRFASQGGTHHDRLVWRDACTDRPARCAMALPASTG
jgi:hypothetical protein